MEEKQVNRLNGKDAKSEILSSNSERKITQTVGIHSHADSIVFGGI